MNVKLKMKIGFTSQGYEAPRAERVEVGNGRGR